MDFQKTGCTRRRSGEGSVAIDSNLWLANTNTDKIQIYYRHKYR